MITTKKLNLIVDGLTTQIKELKAKITNQDVIINEIGERSRKNMENLKNIVDFFKDDLYDIKFCNCNYDMPFPPEDDNSFFLGVKYIWDSQVCECNSAIAIRSFDEVEIVSQSKFNAILRINNQGYLLQKSEHTIIPLPDIDIILDQKKSVEKQVENENINNLDQIKTGK